MRQKEKIMDQVEKGDGEVMSVVCSQTTQCQNVKSSNDNSYVLFRGKETL